MSEYAEIENGVCVNVVIADADWIAEQGGEWRDITGEAGVGIGWQWDGSVWTEPAAPAPTTRTVLTGMEWVETWTDDEWRSLKNASQADTSVGRKIDKLLDAIKLAGSFDVQGTTAETFYSFLEAQGHITAQRRAELQSGVLA